MEMPYISPELLNALSVLCPMDFNAKQTIEERVWMESRLQLVRELSFISKAQTEGGTDISKVQVRYED